LFVFVSVCASVEAQPHGSGGRQFTGPPLHRAPPTQTMRERWLALPPAAQQRFRSNAERWMQMSPEQRNVMREREKVRREQIKRETEAAVHDSGLHLSPQEQALFESRYIQERQRMEHALRQQIDAEREQELSALIQQLKKEFPSKQPAQSATKPSASPK